MVSGAELARRRDEHEVVRRLGWPVLNVPGVEADDIIATLALAGAEAGLDVPIIAGDNWGNSLAVEGFDAGPDTNTNACNNNTNRCKNSDRYTKTIGIK